MSASRFPVKVIEYCGQIAQKISEGKVWKQDWDLLIISLYSSKSRSSLCGELGLPSSVPPYKYDPGDIEELMKEMEDILNSIAEDVRLANIDLQNKLTGQSNQTLQMTSGISKKLHDSAMSIIRNIG